MARNLIVIGIVFVLLGLLWPWLSKVPLGRLPGDIVVRRDNFTLFFPLGSSLLISLILSVLFWLFRK